MHHKADQSPEITDEGNRTSQNGARPRTVVEYVEAVAAGGMVEHVDRQVGLDRRFYEPVEASLQPSVLLESRTSEQQRRQGIENAGQRADRRILVLIGVQYRVIRNDAAQPLGAIAEDRRNEAAGTGEDPDAETVGVDAELHGVVAEIVDDAFDIGDGIDEMIGTEVAMIEHRGHPSRRRDEPPDRLEGRPVFRLSCEVGRNRAAVNHDNQRRSCIG